MSNITEHIPRLLRLVFMGTADFAVASLEALCNNGFNVVAVVTAPDKPAGRGLQLNESPVKKYATTRNLPILQPEKLKSPSFIEQLKFYQADAQIVVAFRMLPEIVWNMPPLGTINVHASLLPQYRGAAPIHWAVINGEKETGVTTFKLQHEIDTGNILLQEKINIGDDETTGSVYERLKILGAELLIKTIQQLETGILEEQSQLSILNSQLSTLKHAPKIFTEHCIIDWNKPAQEIFNLIRGLSPHPGAIGDLDGKVLKVYASKTENATLKIKPGQYETDKKTYLRFACVDGYLYLTDIQLEGKKRMLIEDFLRGYRFNE
ncbi:MAG TPA: methionyl-tRNA formyltransferase [Sediminibacterium sp.]|nr:methionyl-tRNA formyltransferase [Sediminibacterium sp.]